MLHDASQDLHDRASMIAAFERHNRAVIEGLPAERLLVYRAEQGWEPLCRFLDLPLPQTPFPHINTRSDFQAMLAATRTPEGVVDAERRRQIITGRPGATP